MWVVFSRNDGARDRRELYDYANWGGICAWFNHGSALSEKAEAQETPKKESQKKLEVL